MNAADVPLIINWFEDSTAIARALGLEIELPDVNREDAGYWNCFDRDTWRRQLIGKVDMTAAEFAQGDPDWVRLKRLGGTIEAWFDLEEGIRFRCKASEAVRVASVIRQLAARDGLPLAIGDVVAHQTIAGGDVPCGPELAPWVEPAGFRWDRNHWSLEL